MEKESALAALRGLMESASPGQSITVHCGSGFFALDLQKNDEPPVI
jgi:hypothetical protein